MLSGGGWPAHCGDYGSDRGEGFHDRSATAGSLAGLRTRGWGAAPSCEDEMVLYPPGCPGAMPAPILLRILWGSSTSSDPGPRQDQAKISEVVADPSRADRNDRAPCHRHLLSKGAIR